MHTHSLPASERLEQAVLRALHEGAPEKTRTDLGLQFVELDGVLVSIARHGDIILNRTLGLGLTRPADVHTVQQIRDLYGDAGVKRFFVHVAPQAEPQRLGQWLTDAGLRPHRRWMKFVRGREPAPQTHSSLSVREIGHESAEPFGRIAAAAFDLPPHAAPLFDGLIGRHGFHLYMAFDGDAPAGTGLLYIDGSDAWFDFGATDPEFRRRGSQRAMLARRVEDAIGAGCKRMMTCTGEAVPGDPQHSYHNIEWAGFRPDYLRDNWIPA